MFSYHSSSVLPMRINTCQEDPELNGDYHEPVDIAIGAMEIQDDGQMSTDENDNNRCESRGVAMSDDEKPRAQHGRGLRSPLGFQNRGRFDDDYVDVEGGCGHGELDYDRLPSLLSIKIES